MHDLQLLDQDQGHFMDKNVEKLYKSLCLEPPLEV